MVIPTKGNVGNDNYAATIRSVEHLIKQFSVLKGSSHIAIVQFANKAKVRFDLSDLSSPDKLQKVIQAMHNENEDLGKEMHYGRFPKRFSRKIETNALARLRSLFFSHTNQPTMTKAT